MTPAPSVRHQRIAGNLYYRVRSAFQEQPCHVYFAPFDVRLYNRKKYQKASKEIFTVVQPDLCVICDETKLDEQGCNGAPDLVIEILSPGNTKREMNEKFELYEGAGVGEYWLVHPADEVVLIYVLNEDERYIGLRPATEVVHCAIFPELRVDSGEVFGGGIVC